MEETGRSWGYYENKAKKYTVVRNKKYVYKIWWYPNGVLQSTGRYLSNGNTDGSVIFYHSNGKKSQEGHYKNNKTIGWYKFYNEQGLLTEKHFYDKNGVVTKTYRIAP